MELPSKSPSSAKRWMGLLLRHLPHSTDPLPEPKIFLHCQAPAQTYKPRLRPMISFMISVVPPKIDWTRLGRRAHNLAGEHRTDSLAIQGQSQSGQREPRCSRGVIWAVIAR